MAITNDKREELFYYFALYHMLGMATAYLTILVLLVSMAFLLSTSTIGVKHPGAAVLAVFVLWGIEIYFVIRMRKFRAHVTECVGSDNVKKLESIPHSRTVTTTIGATLAALWDILLILNAFSWLCSCGEIRT